MPEDSGVGGSAVGPFGVVLWAIAIFLAAGLALAALIQVWPSSGSAPSEGYVVLGQHVTLSRDHDLFVLVSLSGAMGGFIHAVRSVAWHVGNRTLKRSWLLFFVGLPLVGALLGTTLYVVFRGGLVSGQAPAADVNVYGVAATAALGGMFSSQAVEKLKDVFTTLFAQAPQGNDPSPPSGG